MTFDSLIHTLESFETKSFGRSALDEESDAASLRLGVGLRGGYKSASCTVIGPCTHRR